MMRIALPLVLAVTMLASAQSAELKRVEYNNPGLVVDLGVGLWGWPLPMDYDRDGDLDLVVSCSDVPYNGLYLFENPGSGEKMPVFKAARRIGAGERNISVCYPDGNPRVLLPGSELVGFADGDLKTNRKLYPKTTLMDGGRVRANQWSYADYDGDGTLDLVVGHGYWGDYGWDDAFNEAGEWTRGPLHGYVYVIRNDGTDEKPDYEEPMRVTAGDRPVDVYGMPSPNFADFDSDGDLDLLCGDFIDGFTYFQNVGTRTEPRYASGRELTRDGKPLEMHLCMIVVVALDWDKDGDVDLVVGQEDGRVALVEHTGETRNGMPVFEQPRFFRQEAQDVKFGALITPVSVDWDGDGDEDLVAGNSAGEIGFIENLDGGDPPQWAAPKLLKAGGKPIRILAGPNGSIQGPAEAKWGYTTQDVADWDHDGDLDIVVNSIWGRIVWYENVGTRTSPKLAAARSIKVQWPGEPPKPPWNWWSPAKHELATQWRTTPLVIDWDRDGINDLVMLDHEGYLSLFRRAKRDDELVLGPGERIFGGGTFDRKRELVRKDGPLRLNDGTAGKSGRRKLCIVDLDGDGKRDLLVNSRNVNLMRNVSTDDAHPTFVDTGPLDSHRLAGHTTSPTTVDWDGDGVRDLLVGAEDGYLYHMSNPLVGKPGAAAQQAPEEPPAHPLTPRPNVLFIAVDDLRVELGCYGNTLVQSPSIDKLAARGTLFTRAYCQQAVCNPSRASMLTGLRPSTLGVWDLPTHFRQRRPEVVTLPQHFKRHGYFTQNIGKIFHNWRQDKYKGDSASWSVPAVMHYNTHGADKPQVDGVLPPNLVDTPRCEMRDVPDDAYFDGRIAAMAVESLRELTGEHQPFFLAVGFWKPHADFNAPKKYWDLYDRAAIMPPINSDAPKGVPDVAMHDAREIMRGFRKHPGGKPSADDVLTLRHGYYAATSYVDAQVGKVIDAVDQLGLADNTVIVLWSDHGYHLGEHALWAKTSNFELDARVPMIIATPNHSGGQRTEALVELLDLYPTLSDLCGLPAPKSAEGVTLRPLLDAPNTTVKPAAFTWHPRPAYPPKGSDPDVMGYSMRTDRYRYTEWRNFTTGEVVARELYDHTHDPGETVNLDGDEDYQASVEALAKQLAAMHPRGPAVESDSSKLRK